MAFQPRFQPGQSVILSNPKSNRSEYKGQEFIITRYENDGDGRPYRLSNGLYVGAAELTAVKEELNENGEPLINLLVTEVPKQEVKEAVNINQVVFQAQDFKVGNPVSVVSFPQPAQYHYYGFNKVIIHHIADNNYYYQRRVGRNGVIAQVDTANARYYVEYSDNTGSDWFPAISLQPHVGSFDPVFYTFQGSGERSVRVYKDRVMVGSETFQFDLFDRILEMINAHKVTPKTGNDRRVPISDRWTGILRDTHLEVGCQQFPYKNIKRLCAAIREVRKVTSK